MKRRKPPSRKPRRARSKANNQSTSRGKSSKSRGDGLVSGELIAKAGHELATSLDYQATLKNVTNLIVPAAASDCFILLKQPDGRAELVASAHSDPERAEALLGFIDRLNPELHPGLPVFKVLRSGEPMLIHDPELALDSPPRPDEEGLRLIIKLGLQSRIVVPLKARGETIGVMTMLSNDSRQRYTAADLKIATEIALRVAYSIDNARLHEAEKLANQRFSDLLNGLRASVWEAVWEPHGNPVDEVTFINQAAEGLLGYPAHQLRDRSASRVLIPDPDFSRVMNEYSAGILSGRDFEVQYRVRHGDGRMIWLQDVVRVSRSANGRPMVRTVTTDISKLKEVEEHLRILAEAGKTLDSSLEYEATLTNVTGVIVPALADDCIIFLESESGKLEMVSSAHSDTARAEVARDFFRRYPLFERPEQPLQVVHSTGQSILMADELNVPDAGTELSRTQYESSIGRQISAGLAVPMRSRGRTIGVMVWVSVESGRHYTRSDLKLAEEIAARAALAVDNARLFKSAQDGVEARDRFLAMLGHELRNPLNSIGIVAKMLERESLSDERLTRLRAIIGRETRQLSTLVDDLLDVSRVLAGKLSLTLQPTDLSALVRESALSFEDRARQRGQALLVTVPETPTLVTADPVRIHQLVANLVTNAIKFTDTAGRIEVTLCTKANVAVLRVSDSGIGIAPEMLERIFEPFAQAALLPPHGLGLGLSVVKQVVELHGGKVTVSSEGIGRGSEFTVILPCASV